MDFRTRKSGRVHTKIEVDSSESEYPHNVLLYRLPPTQDITLQEFEEFAIERVNLLRIFEQASSKNLRILSEEWKVSIKEEMQQAGMKAYLRLIAGHSSTSEQDLEARRRDYISHFILRLAYCRSPDLKKWFKTYELEWFKFKFSMLTSPEIKRYLEVNKMDYQPITEEEKNDLREHLNGSTKGYGAERVNLEEFFRVIWTEVPDLVRGRRCYIKNGYAYVIASDFVSVVAGLHEACIENGLNTAAELMPNIENDERIVGFVKSLHTSYTGKDYAVHRGERVPIESIDQLSKKSFPMCMRQCHEILRTKHHHKHHGRQQYGLFLKGIGVTLEDSLRFWRQEFTKMMDLDKFEKTYSYNIRYNYGKEGQQRNWAPWSCLKVISTPAGPQDTHGCPFKTLDANSLRAKLSTYGFSSVHTQEISGYASKGHYQIACGRYFAVMHSLPNDESITHPNSYYEKSQALIENRATDGTSKSQMTPSQNPKAKKSNKMFLDEYDDDYWYLTQASQAIELREQSIMETQAFQEKVDDEDEYLNHLADHYLSEEQAALAVVDNMESQALKN